MSLPESGSPADPWDAMKTELVNNGDIAAAISHFSGLSAADYRQAYVSVGIADLSAAISPIGTLTPAVIGNDTAQYYFEQPIDGQTITFPVKFIRENGVWKILEF